jgi:hypothetical protein
MNLRSEEQEEALEHEAREGDEVQAGQGRRQALVVAGEAAEPGRPGEVALKDPATVPVRRFSSVGCGIGGTFLSWAV